MYWMVFVRKRLSAHYCSDCRKNSYAADILRSWKTPPKNLEGLLQVKIQLNKACGTFRHTNVMVQTAFMQQIMVDYKYQENTGVCHTYAGTSPLVPASLNPGHKQITLQETVSLQIQPSQMKKGVIKNSGTKWHANKEELKKSLPSLTNYLVNYKPLWKAPTVDRLSDYTLHLSPLSTV